MFETERFTRIPFDVEAVRITAKNFNQVVIWSGGQVKGKTPYIKVPTFSTKDRHSRGYIGDWVVKSRHGISVFTDASFHKTFEKKDQWGHVVIQGGAMLEGERKQYALEKLHEELSNGSNDFAHLAEVSPMAKLQPTHGIPVKIGDQVVGHAAMDADGNITAKVTDPDAQQKLETSSFRGSIANFFNEVEASRMPEPDPNR